MNVTFLEKGNHGRYKKPTISIRDSVGMSIYKSAMRKLFDEFDGTPDSVKIGVDDEAEWIVLLPVEGNDGYFLPDEVQSHSLCTKTIKNFIIEESQRINETDLPINLEGYWDDTEGALLFEYNELGES